MTLEPRNAAHAEALYAVLADPALYDFIEDAPPESVQSLRERLARTESRRSPDGTEHWLNWVVRDAHGDVAGYVQATVHSDGEAHVAYMIGTAWQGRGLATAAVRRMLDLVAAEFGVHRFAIVAERRNTKSVGVAERLGFAEVSPAIAARQRIAAGDVLLEKVVAPEPAIAG